MSFELAYIASETCRSYHSDNMHVIGEEKMEKTLTIKDYIIICFSIGGSVGQLGQLNQACRCFLG